MKDTYCKRTYECKCRRLTNEYNWQSELTKHKVKCFQCGNQLGIESIKTKEQPQTASIRTPTKNR